MSKAEEYYDEHYKGHGIAPKHVVALKKIIASAFRKGAKPSVAAKVFFKEKGIELKKTDAEDENDMTDVELEEHREDKTKKVKKRVKEKTPVIPAPAVEIRNMDRKDLKATIEQLKSAGVEIEYKKSDTDDVLARKLNDAMAKLPSPALLATLEMVDPDKVVNAIGQPECLGLFVDLRSSSCIACGDVQACLKQYLVNLKGDFSQFKDAMVEIKTEEAAEAITEEEVEAVKKSSEKTKKSSEKKEKRIPYEPDKRIFITDIVNPYEEEEDAHSTTTRIQEEMPSTEKELYDLVADEWDIPTHDAFVVDWVVLLREKGVLMFEEDLDAEQRKALKKAGAL